MTWDRKALKVSFLFLTSVASESAVTSVHLAGTATSYDPVPDLAAFTQTQANTLATNLSNLMNDTNLRWADYSRIVGIKVAALGTNKLELTDSVSFNVSPTVSAGSASNVAPQDSVAVTLWSGQHLGKGNFGRMYLPHTAYALSGTAMNASQTVANGVRTAAVAFLQAVNTVGGALSAGTGLRIMSDAGVSKAVAQCGVGTTIDTQRRRRRQLPDTKVYVTI